MPVAGGPERRDGARMGLLHAQRRRGCAPVGLLGVVAGTLPGNEGSAHGEQGGGVLDEHGERSESTSSDEVVRTDPLRPRLGPGLDRLDVGELEALDCPPQEVDLPADALYEGDTRIRERDRQHESGKPATRAEIGDPPRVPDLGQLERDERVRHVHIDALRRIPNRRDRAVLGRDQVQQQRQPIRRRGPQAVAVSEFGEPVRDVGASENRETSGYTTNGATTRCRAGSSPSLYVSTPPRSRRYSWTSLRSLAVIASRAMGRP
jgi:hypothetical protein